MNKEKYIVFKTEEFEKLLDQQGDKADAFTLIHDLSQIELEDFVVIRLADQFAAPALFEYGNAIQTLLDFLRSMEIGSKLSHIGDVSEEEYDDTIDRLIGIRDYFFEKAQQSQTMTRKLPD